jgi:hypothetical protein
VPTVHTDDVRANDQRSNRGHRLARSRTKKRRAPSRVTFDGPPFGLPSPREEKRIARMLRPRECMREGERERERERETE